MKVNSLLINEKDNVVVVTDCLKKGDTAVFLRNGKCVNVIVKNDIPIYHKICIKEIHQNESVIKYGESLGLAKCEIPVGDYVHTHNLQSQREGMDN